MSVLLRGRAGKVLVARRYLATHAPLQGKDCTSITPPYNALQEKLALVRKLLNNRSLTLAEKILYSHLANPEETIGGGGLKRGETYLLLHPQVRRYFLPHPRQILTLVGSKRVAMQDASAQYVLPSPPVLSLLISVDFSEWRCKSLPRWKYHLFSLIGINRLQFMSAGLSKCAVPVSIHCDHLIQASSGAHADLEVIIFYWTPRNASYLPYRTRLFPTKRYLTFWRVRPRSMGSSSGNLGPGLFTKSYWKTMPLQEC